jgi:hypothetical protein
MPRSTPRSTPRPTPRSAPRRTTLALIAALGVTSTLGACRHYRVTDLSNGSTYYTKDVDHQDDGAVTFRDRRDDTKVTVQNNKVDRITKREYKDATRDPDDNPVNNQ